MKLILGGLLFILVSSLAAAQRPSLTIYNQNFAVIREILPLTLKAGLNRVQYTGATLYLEPPSVMLRDPSARVALQVVEQNYRADPVTEASLLSLHEGQTIEFEAGGGAPGQVPQIIRGKLIRSSGGPRVLPPIVEVDGKLRFTLPGRPIFPRMADSAILKPTLDWSVYSPEAVSVNAEVSYISGGLHWRADYNLIMPENGNTLEFAGWVTINNQSGREFDKANIKLMAGTVNKVAPTYPYESRYASSMTAQGPGNVPPPPPTVTERSFDEYHLYTLPLATTLQDRETKQVEFVRAARVPARRLYIYDGARIDQRYVGHESTYSRLQADYGVTGSSTRVAVYMEFDNSKANGLGIAIPRGRLRFYRRNEANSSALEFIGENEVGHTPKDEKILANIGDAFDLAAERRRTSFQVDNNGRGATETFEIRVRNHKTVPVEVRIVEHLYRWTNWQLLNDSLPWRKTDSKTIEFTANIAPDKEQVLNYTVQYSW